MKTREEQAVALFKEGSEVNAAQLRDGFTPSRGQLLAMVVRLSLPVVIAELCSTAMQYIDAAMVGSLGEVATASIGIVESTTWLVGGLCTAAATGFSVQVAQLVGANRLGDARNVLRQSIIVLIGFSLLLGAVCAALSGPLPIWLGAEPDVVVGASAYLLVFALGLPFLQLNRACVNMLQCSGDMRTPSALNVLMCALDVVFNLAFIFPTRTVTVFGASITLWNMLQCSGDMRTPSALNVLMCALDVVFNLAFIFPTRTVTVFGASITLWGAGLGVVGAAIGTVVAEAIVALLMLWATCVRSPVLKLFGGDTNGARWRPTSRCLRTAARISAPIALERVLINGAQIVSTGIVAPLGTTAVAANALAVTAESLCYMPGFGIGSAATTLVGQAQIVSTGIVAPLGTTAVAANALAVTAESLCYMPGFGIGSAATTLVGQSIGANRRDLTRRFARTSVALGMGIMTVMGVLMYLLAPAMLALLTPVAAVQALGTEVLRIEAFAEPLFGAAIVCAGALRGAGDTLGPSLINLTTMWGIRITMAALLAPRIGLAGVWIAMCVELCVRGSLFLVRLLRERWLTRASVV